MINRNEPTKYFDTLYHIKYKDQSILCTSYEYSPVFESQYNTIMRFFTNTLISNKKIEITCADANENREGVCGDCKKVIKTDDSYYFFNQLRSCETYSWWDRNCAVHSHCRSACNNGMGEWRLWEINPSLQPKEIILDSRECTITTLMDKERQEYPMYIPEEYAAIIENMISRKIESFDQKFNEWKAKYKSQYEPVEDTRIEAPTSPIPTVDFPIEQKSMWMRIKERFFK